MGLKVGGMKLTSSSVEYGLRLERRFSTALKSILGRQFIVADPAEDTERGADFVVWTLAPIRIAVRLRTYRFFLRYPDQFTLRWSLPSGNLTEIHKIRRGLVDYFLYGFVDEAEKDIISYFIGDLSIFRRINPKPVDIKWNDPPDSQLAVFNLAQLPPEFIIKAWKKG